MWLEYLRFIVLGIIQGISEFLPISSDGHLVIGEALLNAITGETSTGHGMFEEVALHIGTLGAIVVIYWKDLIAALTDRKLLLSMVIATIPAVIVGLTLKDWFDATFDSPIIAAVGLLVTAIFLLTAQWLERNDGVDQEITPMIALVIGLFQSLALLPGVSRSGSTISSAVLMGVSRLSAARFSFLIAVPAVSGAIVLTMKDLITKPALQPHWGPLMVGVAISFVVGLAALKVLLAMLARYPLSWFAYYCIAAGLGVLLWQGLGA